MTFTVRWTGLFLTVLVFSTGWIFSDELETLIDKEKDAKAAWSGSEGDLPPLNLPGDRSGMLIYHAGLERAKENLLCSDILFDELFETSQPPRNESAIINVNRPRIRQSLEDRCLIRPGDPLLAVGPGWQELVSAKDFQVRPEPGACKNDPPHSLWITFDGTLPDAPFFFTTVLDWPAGSTPFQRLDETQATEVDEALIRRLRSEVPFAEEYRGLVYEVSAPNCDRLIHLVKETVSNEDADLPNEIVVAEKDGGFQTLILERIETTEPSGRLRPLGLIDFDADELLDLIIEGEQGSCTYRAVFKGLDGGFERLSVPIPPCSC